MTILFLSLALMIMPQADVSLQPAVPVAGQDLTISAPAGSTAGFISVSTPLGNWRKSCAVTGDTTSLTVTVPADAPALLIGYSRTGTLDFPHRVYPVVAADGSAIEMTGFWLIYLEAGFPAPFPVAGQEITKTLADARALSEKSPDSTLITDLTWRLEIAGLANQTERDALLNRIDAELAAGSSPRLISAAYQAHLVAGDRQGAEAVMSTYAAQIRDWQQAEANRWSGILALNDASARAQAIHAWLMEDPLSSYCPFSFQVLAASYAAMQDHRATALFGLMSLRATPEDAMTLNGVAFAMAEGRFEMERGLLLAERALSILKNPARLSRPPQMSEARWQRELNHALAAAYDTKGWLLTGLKRWKEAREALDEGLTYEKTEDIYLHYGILYKEQGNLTEAKKQLEEGLKYARSKRLEFELLLDEIAR